MKKRLLFVLAAALTMGFAACSDDDDNKPAGGDNNSTNISAQVVGSWMLDSMYIDGTYMQIPAMLVTMNADGTGEVASDFVREYSSFNWNTQGNALNCRFKNGTDVNFNVVKVNAEVLVVRGNGIPGTEMEGDIVVRLVKFNGEWPEADSVLAGSSWDATIDTTISMRPFAEMDMVLNMRIGLNFSLNGRDGTIESSGLMSYYGVVEGDTIDNSENLDMAVGYTYTFDATSNTGYIVYVDEDMAEDDDLASDDDDNDVEDSEPVVMPFIYHPENNTIVIEAPAEADVYGMSRLVFYRRNESVVSGIHPQCKE